MSKNRFNKYISNTSTFSETNISNEEATQESLEITEDITENTSPPSVIETSSPSVTEKELNTSTKEVSVSKTTEQAAVTNENKPTNMKGFTPVYKVELALNNYMEHMDITKIINPNDGARWQYSLLTTIKEVLNAPSQEEFNKEWNTILNFFNTNNKVPALTENFIFRFPSEWVGSPIEYKIFQHLVYLIINTSNPQTRKKNLLDINLEIMTEGLTLEQKNKIINFYMV